MHLSILALYSVLHGVLTLNVGPEYNHPIEGLFRWLTFLFYAIFGGGHSSLADLDVDLPFSQPVTFAHLEWQRCLAASHDHVCICSKQTQQNPLSNAIASPSILPFLAFPTIHQHLIVPGHVSVQGASELGRQERKRAVVTTQYGR